MARELFSLTTLNKFATEHLILHTEHKFAHTLLPCHTLTSSGINLFEIFESETLLIIFKCNL